MSVDLISGSSAALLDIDATAKAARTTAYSLDGTYQGKKATYRASSLVPFSAAVTINIPWFLIEGSATKTIVVKRIGISGLTLTAVQYLTVSVTKFSTAASGGTATSAPMVPLDSSYAAATAAFVKYYTAVPTAGTIVGSVATWRTLAQVTTAVAAGTTDQYVFSFGDMEDTRGIYLRGVAQGVGLIWTVAPGSATVVNCDIEWTEE